VPGATDHAATGELTTIIDHNDLRRTD
jgi:hypothetical protein